MADVKPLILTSSGLIQRIQTGDTVPLLNGGTGSTTAAGARTNFGATTVGGNLFTAANPSAVRFLRVNADNTITWRTAAEMVSDIGAVSGSAYLPLAGGTMSGQAGMTGAYPLWAFGGASGVESCFIGGGGSWGNTMILRAYDTTAHGTFIDATLSYGTGFKVFGRLETTSHIQAGDGSNGMKVYVGNDAGLSDVGAAHLMGVVSQSDSTKGGFQFGTGASIYRDGGYLTVSGGGLQIGPVGGEGGELILSGSGGSGGDAAFDSNGDNFRWFGHPSGKVMTWNRSSGQLNVPGTLQIGADLYIPGEAYNDGWYRTQQSGKGWYHSVHGGGWYMDDSTWVKAYNGKGIWSSNTVQGNRIEATAGGMYQLNATSSAWIRQPRIFIGGSDPGSQASDGDIWIP